MQEIQLFIQCNNRNFTTNINLNDDIDLLKENIYNYTNLQKEKQKLYFNGKELSKGTIYQNNIKKNGVINLLTNLNGGLWGVGVGGNKHDQSQTNDSSSEVEMLSADYSKTTISSENISSNDIKTLNKTDQTSIIDNSINSGVTMNNDTKINSSQKISNFNNVDQSVRLSMDNSTDTYNVDESVVNNVNETEILNEMISTCDMTFQDAQAVINIVKDESKNTTIDASNSIILSGDGNELDNVNIESKIDFIEGDEMKACVLEQANILKNQLNATNQNSKSMEGGSGGDMGAKAGGNSNDNSNSSKSEDTMDTGNDAGITAEGANDTSSGFKNTNEVVNDISQEQKGEAKFKKSQEQKATSEGGTSGGGAGGGLSDNFLIVLFIIAVCMILKKVLKK